MHVYRAVGKRVLDIAAAATTLLLLSPLLAVIAIAIYRDDKGRVIFRQRRIGRDGQPFWLLKFRSMPEQTGDIPSHAAGAIRPTRVGTWIRRTNLDELPQLVNILRGEMSLVGPRPGLPSQEELLRLRQENGALTCLPGLTGLAQVNAYTGMPVPEKAQWDAAYARRITFAGDVGIVLRTVGYLCSPPPVY